MLQLLEARWNVHAAGEMHFWKDITADMMSDEEDGTFDEMHLAAAKMAPTPPLHTGVCCTGSNSSSSIF